MFLLNGKKINIGAMIEFEDARYPNLYKEADRIKVGVVEVPDPVYPDPDLYYWTENLDGSLNITDKSPEQIAQIKMAKAKSVRTQEVNEILVTTTAGNEFDGHEDAQSRMAKAIVAMDDTDKTLWVLANNSIVEVTKAELREALRLAGVAQTLIWMKPYQ